MSTTTEDIKATHKPCNECPFRKTSIRGYLGPWDSPLELLSQALSEAGFACHCSIKADEKWQGASICAGSLHCANKSFKTYRPGPNPFGVSLYDAQRSVNEADADSIMDAQEFIAYHSEIKPKEEQK